LPFLLDLSNASNLLKLNHWYQLFDKLKSLNLGFLIHHMLSYNWIRFKE
jgi:hypothetical protein